MKLWKIKNGRAIPVSKENTIKFLSQPSEELDPTVIDEDELVSSSTVERHAVNVGVTGSNPVWPATE